MGYGNGEKSHEKIERKNDENDSMDQKLINKTKLRKCTKGKIMSQYKLPTDNATQRQEPHSLRIQARTQNTV